MVGWFLWRLQGESPIALPACPHAPSPSSEPSLWSFLSPSPTPPGLPHRRTCDCTGPPVARTPCSSGSLSSFHLHGPPAIGGDSHSHGARTWMSSWLTELPTAYVETCKCSTSAACPPGPLLGQQPCPHHTVGHSEHLALTALGRRRAHAPCAVPMISH